MTAAPRLMLCMAPGCRRAAAPDSCYCERCFHQRLDGIMPERARASRVPLLLAMLMFAAIAWWARDDLQAWLSPLFATAATVQTPAPEGCRMPGEGERLMIYIARRDDRLVARCQYIVTKSRKRVELQGFYL